MDNILAVKVLIGHYDEITDGAYKTATEIAIERLIKDILDEYEFRNFIKVYNLSFKEFIDLDDETYKKWIIDRGISPNNKEKCLQTEEIDVDKEIRSYKNTLKTMKDMGY